MVKRASDVMGIPKTGPRPEKQARKGPADAIPIIGEPGVL